MNWPISFLDAYVAGAALRSTTWLEHTRSRLLSTASRMEALLTRHVGPVVPAPLVHYRFVPTRDYAAAQARLLDAGVMVRAFSAGEPGRIPGLRITAPTEAELGRLERALTKGGLRS